MSQYTYTRRLTPQLMTASAEEAYPELLDLVPTIEAIQNTLLVVGGGYNVPAVSLMPLARSWCLYEIAHTPPGALRVHVGWSPWRLVEQQRVKFGIDCLDVAKAQSFDPKDKRMIDMRVIDSFGTFERANEQIRAAVLHGYFVAVANAYQQAPARTVPASGAPSPHPLPLPCAQF